MTKTRIYTPSDPKFSLHWWLGGIRNWFFVAVVTFMVWSYADMEFTEDRDFQATIDLTTGQSPDIVLLSSPTVEVTFKLRGTRSTLAAFQSQLEKSPLRITYDVSRGYPAGASMTIRTVELLEDMGELSRKGLSVVSATPSQISVLLDQRVQQLALVELDASGATLVVPAKIIPEEVQLDMAKSDQEKLLVGLEAGSLPKVKTRRLDLRAVPSGQPFTTELELVSPVTKNPVTIQPKMVKVTVRVDQRTGEKKLRIAVQIQSPPTWADDETWRNYELIFKDPLEWQPEILLTGAKKDLDRIRSEDIDAYITLTDNDKTPVDSWLSRAVHIHLPRDMEVQLEGEIPQVHFRLQQRPLAVPSAAAP